MTFANIFFPRNIFAERGAREDADIDLESFSFSARVGDTFSMMGPLPGFWNAVRRLLWMGGYGPVKYRITHVSPHVAAFEEIDP